MALDRKRLIQFMGMTGSDADGEALTAIRMANRLIKEANMSWAELLAAKPPPLGMPVTDWRTRPSKRKAGAGTSQYGRPAPRHRHNPDVGRNSGDDIQEMLAALATKRLEMSTMMFLASLNTHWETKGYLTDPQYDALKQMHSGRF